jgi:hypothetical protein
LRCAGQRAFVTLLSDNPSFSSFGRILDNFSQEIPYKDSERKKQLDRSDAAPTKVRAVFPEMCITKMATTSVEIFPIKPFGLSRQRRLYYFD